MSVTRRETLARDLLLAAALFLVVAGVVMVYSAASVSDYVQHGDSAFHLKRHLQWLAVGVVVMFGLSRFDYRRLARLSWPLWAVSVAGLVAVLVMGVSRWGARRWVEWGGNSIQPSEFAKLATVLLLAHLLSRRSRNGPAEEERRRDLAILALVILPVAGLVMAQPDMGTTMAILASGLVVAVLGGLAGRSIAGLIAMGAVVMPVMVFVEPYRMARLFSFIDPWADPLGDGYQTIQALYAFGSGGLTGVGLGMSKQKFFYLPAAHTDFIFAIIGEELGLLGTLAVVAVFAVLAYAGIRVALECGDRLGRLLAGGLTAMIVMQALMNMAAVTNLMPVTGIPLPLVSFGGSSLIFTMGCIGIILSVWRYGGKTTREARSASTADRGRDGRTRVSRAGRRAVSGLTRS